MKVIVVRQLWAWLIVNGFKDIENRTWATRYRGTLLIQASANLPSKAKWDEIERWVRKRGVELPDSFEKGGIVGMAEIEDCVTRSKSKWFEGPDWLGSEASEARPIRALHWPSRPIRSTARSPEATEAAQVIVPVGFEMCYMCY